MYKALLQGSLILLHDVTQMPEYVLSDSNVRSEVAIPIRSHGVSEIEGQSDTFGVLNLESFTSSRFGQRDVETLTALVELVSIA